jgi:hypothetical protein
MRSKQKNLKKLLHNQNLLLTFTNVIKKNNKTMKKSTFILIGMMLTLLAIGMVACTHVPAGSLSNHNTIQEIDRNAFENTMRVIESSTTKPVIIQKIGQLGETPMGVYDLKYEGKTYLIVGRHTGVSIIEHTPKVTPKVNMDSVVANSKWIPEYSMLGYTKAQPSKQSLESYHNPEKRPVPVGTEKEFFEYHTKE